MNNILLLSFLSIAILACQKNSLSPVERWTVEEPSQNTNLQEARRALDSQSSRFKVDQDSFYLNDLQHEGITFLDHHQHGVKSTTKGWQVLSQKASPEVPWLELWRARWLKQNTKVLLTHFYKENKGYKIIEHQVVFRDSPTKGHVEAAWKVIVFNSNETDVFQFLYNNEFEILEKKSVANHFVRGDAQVFNGRPDWVDLEIQPLLDLKGDGTLDGQRIQLVSERDQKVYSPLNQFRYDPQDPLFDDVQAYYFADRAVLWFSDNLNLQLDQDLEVKVHVGHPQKANTAFYYDHKIRLGDGDGKTYKSMTQDPTIVSHEVAHGFIKKISGLPFEGEGGSLNEAFADFFAADITGQAQMAGFSYVPGPYKRTLENTKTFADLKGSLYGDSLLVSGTLWDIRSILGPERTRKLAVKTLMRLGPYGRIKDLVPSILSVLPDNLNEPEKASIQQLLYQKRLWPQEQKADE